MKSAVNDRIYLLIDLTNAGAEPVNDGSFFIDLPKAMAFVTCATEKNNKNMQWCKSLSNHVSFQWAVNTFLGTKCYVQEEQNIKTTQ